MKVKADMELAAGKILCAVSGGGDSMCMLHLLWSSGADVAAAHYEHGIRGNEAKRDAEFVDSWCRERGIECIVGHGDVHGYAKEHGMGTEEAARLLRYEFLTETAETLECRYIATAHNADDNAETMIFNLTRGAGSAGLRGIPVSRDNIIRPMIRYSRADIEAYNSENRVPYVEDSTNRSDEYSRNLIRHRVMPVLRQINPELASACLRTSELMRSDEDCLGGMADDFLRDNYDGKSVDAKKLCALHPAIAARVIRKLAPRTLSMEQVNAVLELCRSRESQSVDVPGMRFLCDRGILYPGADDSISLTERNITIGESLYLPENGMIVTVTEEVFSGEINDLFKTLYLRCENIASVSISGRRAGDKMRPAGRHCTKSLKSLFLEKDWTQAQRNTAPVIREGDEILAVYGIAVDEKAIPLPGDRVIHIKFESIQEKRNQNA